jgi:1,4-dihydroxy-2-naphthoate octaprenyltransferase
LEKADNLFESKEISRTGAWLLAIRPRTLPAAVAPVIVGAAMAFADNGFKIFPALAALLGALLLQIGVNLANDYFDYRKGIDTSDRLGPVRVTQSGLIPPTRVRAGMILVFIIAAAVGLYLVVVGGWPILLVGCAAIIAALSYSGGPYPLASHGLGDLFVFVFFGLVAVCGTYYVQLHQITLVTVLNALPLGLLITAILVVNNLRDINTDRKAGKKTLAVILGKQGTRLEYLLLMLVAYLLPLVFWLSGLLPAGVLLPLVSLPLAISWIRVIMKSEGPILNQALAGTAKTTLVYSLLLSIGIILSF